MKDAGITILQETPSSYAFTINPLVLWGTLFVFFVFFLAISAVIIYHWITYSYAPKTVGRVVKLYGFGAALLLLSTAISATLYTISI